MSILKVPASTIFVSSTWRASNIYDKLKQMNVKVVVEDNMLFDFQIRNRCILYATKERQQGEQFREQIGSCSFKDNNVLAFVDVTQNFYSIQEFLSLNKNIPVIPIEVDSDVAQILALLVQKDESGTKPVQISEPSPECQMIKVLKVLPRIGDVNAEELITNFGSLSTILTASQEELSQIVGERNSQLLYRFLRRIKADK